MMGTWSGLNSLRFKHVLNHDLLSFFQPRVGGRTGPVKHTRGGKKGQGDKENFNKEFSATSNGKM